MGQTVDEFHNVNGNQYVTLKLSNTYFTDGWISYLKCKH